MATTPRKAYMPKKYDSIDIKSGLIPIKSQNIVPSLWTNGLLRGTATLNKSILSNAAVLVWTGNVGSIGNAYAITFTDQNGRYAVSVKTGTTLGIRIYS
ncbi:hypothetical protein [Romboutsia lituseburensis]|uniref:hypothetical protein n=1 Tax=Romboutsia lituseburensis TaxID=1537 RepID=UPI00215B1CCA|nr:hypothetical protein [Romboutsia lituseburensis]MCR8744761.1 hypothetical protein [Romboutsia lituseburensis]